MKFFKQGLTLIELLIVITIIGLLAGVFGINVSKWRARARDSQRVSDIRTIQQGLAFYFYRGEYTGSYPNYDVFITGGDSFSLDLKSIGAMSTVPIDPTNSGNYKYHYCSLQTCTGEADGNIYYIEYWLETSGVSGRIKGQNFARP